MKHTLLSAVLMFTLISCGSSSSPTSAQKSTEVSDASSLLTIMQAEELLLEEAASEDEIKDDLDMDDDGELSKGEMKAGLDSIGQKIKAAIESKHAAMRTARDESKETIQAACGDEHSSPECRAVAQEQRDKLKATRRDMLQELQELQKEIDALQGILLKVETQNEII